LTPSDATKLDGMESEFREPTPPSISVERGILGGEEEEQ
jgi:hypothetical protein